MAIVVATLAGAATLERRVLRPALVLALGLVVAPAFAGHAYDRRRQPPERSRRRLHIAGAAAWVGALVGLVVFRDAEQRRLVLLALGGVLLLGGHRASCAPGGSSSGLSQSLGHVVRTDAARQDRAPARRRSSSAGCCARASGGGPASSSCSPPGSSSRLRPRAARPGRDIEAAPPCASQAARARAGAAVALAARRRARKGGGDARCRAPARAAADDRDRALACGRRASGLGVRLDGSPRRACGHGCYTVDRASGSAVDVQMQVRARRCHDLRSCRRAPAADLLRRRRGALPHATKRLLPRAPRVEPGDLRSRRSGGSRRPDASRVSDPRWSAGDRDRQPALGSVTPDASWSGVEQTQLPQPATRSGPMRM